MEFHWQTNGSRLEHKEGPYRIIMQVENTTWRVDIRLLTGAGKDPEAFAQGSAGSHEGAKIRAAAACRTLMESLLAPERAHAVIAQGDVENADQLVTMDLENSAGTPLEHRS